MCVPSLYCDYYYKKKYNSKIITLVIRLIPHFLKIAILDEIYYYWIFLNLDVISNFASETKTSLRINCYVRTYQ